MKKITISFLCPLFVGLFFTSCLPEGEETELSSTVALLTFGINDLKTQHTITLESGEDSTYTTLMKASLIPFTIDQERGLVYNSDSIAYGTNLTHVTTKISADGYVYYYKDGEKTGYNEEDSIDFTDPVRFTIVSHDNNFSRDYLISINAHKIDPKKTDWRILSGTNFPASLFAEQKSIIKDDAVYVFGHNAEGICYTTWTDINDGIVWSTPTEWTGIEGNPNCLSACLFGGSFYALSDNCLYTSYDGIVWEAVSTNIPLSNLLAVTAEERPMAWGISEGRYVSSTNMTDWEENGQTIDLAPESRISYFSQPLRTNKNINRTLFIGSSPLSTDTCAKVWSKLSTEANWVEVKPVGTNIYGCPNLENLTVINYRDKMYAFGGKSIGVRHIPLKAFSACYESRDNGVTWKVRNSAFSLPENFAGNEDTFSTIVDQHNRVWIIWSTSGEVWQGMWSGIE